MQEITSYLSITKTSQGIYREKGSKFISLAFPVKTDDDVKILLKQIKREYFDARHHCYAYRLGVAGESTRSYDDSEPSGTAGKPILGQLLSFNVTNILVIVVRYFGGTLLGTGGLTQAYKQSTNDCLNKAEIKEFQVLVSLQLDFKYEQMNDVMKVAKEFDIKVLPLNLDTKCVYKLEFEKKHESNIIQKLNTITALKINYLNN